MLQIYEMYFAFLNYIGKNSILLKHHKIDDGGIRTQIPLWVVRIRQNPRIKMGKFDIVIEK